MNYGILIIGVILFVVLIVVYAISSSNGNLNKIKAKTVGDGQYGTSRWATAKEVAKKFIYVPFRPEQWRKGENLPKNPGIIVGSNPERRSAIVDTSDSHTLLISTTGGGKTTCFLYPNMEYACACGLSFLSTDTKGDIPLNYAGISEKYYGYTPYVIDLRYPAHSHGNNMLHLVNKYNDLYEATENITYKARAERYAKITARTIVHMKGFADGGQNAFFYDAAEGLIASMILLVSELCDDKERHIVSVFKLIQELLEIDPSTVIKAAPGQTPPKPKNYFEQLMQFLPSDHKAKWLSGAALSSPTQSMASVMSTAMSRLLSFIDSELEQIICFNSDVDAEQFCHDKVSVFIVFPENDAPKHFMVSLFVKQLYDECLEVANANHNTLKKRVVFFEDEFGTMPPFDDVESMFSAGRSRGLLQVPMIQNFSQLNKHYGKDSSNIIKENCQNVVFGGLTPISETAEELSKSLGYQTVMSGSVSSNSRNGTRSNSTNYQMTRKPLMSADEIKTMPFGHWVVNKTGMYPFQTTISRYDKWGIELDTPYEIAENHMKQVYYADRISLMEAVKHKYGNRKNTYYAPPEENEKHNKKVISKDYL